MGVPVARGSDEGSAGLPVDAAGIGDGSACIELGAHQRVAARVAVDDQIQGHRLVPVRRLDGPRRHDPEHRPEGVGHGAALGQVAVGQQQAEAIAAGCRGIGQQLVEFLLQPGRRVVGGLETGLGGLYAEVAEQGTVVHPIENAGVLGLQQGGLPGGHDEQVAGAPVQGTTRPLQLAGALEHVEEGAGGIGGGLQPLACLDPQKMGRQSGARGRAAAAELGAEIQGDHRCGAALMQLRRPLVVADRFGEARAHRVGGLAVIEQLGFGLPAGRAGLAGFNGAVARLDRGLGHRKRLQARWANAVGSNLLSPTSALPCCCREHRSRFSRRPPRARSTPHRRP